MRAIPRRLLIHAVTLTRENRKDRWGKVADSTAEELKYVRLESSKKIVRDKNNAEIQLSAVLFCDCRNTLPANVNFQVDDIISFNGENYKVKEIEPLYDGKKLHHYEVGLVKYA